jgi:predicted O-methyltransferase YrrM
MRLAPTEVTPQLEEYMLDLLPPRDPVLTRMEAQIERDDVPGIGPHVGGLLALLLRMNRCADVLELGTAIGYSAIWLARGSTGRVITLETDTARARRARANIAEAGLGDRVEVLEEEAMRHLERGGEPVDAIFNDLLNSFPDEVTVERCLELSVARLRPGGLLLADNALGRGRVITAESRPARNIDRYNQLVAADPRLESVIIPIRDGLSLARLAG